MKKILLLSAAACSLLFYACKKDSNTDTTKPITEDTVPTIDPVALASNIKVGYSATSDTGNIPAAASVADAPVLDARYNGQTYYAVNNRYVVIYPTSLSGEVKGYYLMINGSNTHFKIDYATAYNLRKGKVAARKKGDLSGLREGDNSDSSIVIKLPAGLQGDTFSVKYAAYDSLNRVSNTINAIVSVVASANAADDAALLGTWKLTKYQIEDEQFPVLIPDSTNFAYYSCVNNALTLTNNSADIKIAGDINTFGLFFNFKANNLLNLGQTYTTATFDQESSTCSNLVYTTTTQTSPDQPGISYAYNATTKMMTMIYDYDGRGDNLTTQQYTVTELTSGKLAMYAVLYDQGDHDQITVGHFEFQKSEK
jgi:hypothetical protein